MDEQTIREVLVAAVQSSNGYGVRQAIVAAAEGLVEAEKLLAKETQGSLLEKLNHNLACSGS